MLNSTSHRPLTFAVLAVSIVIAFDVFWVRTFIDMPHPHAELGDAAKRLSVIYSGILVPTFLVAYGLALYAVILSLFGRGFRGSCYSAFSRISGGLLCFVIFGFHHFYLWRFITGMHASRHPELLNL